MACVTLTPEVWKRLSTSSNLDRFEWFTDWMPAVGMDKAQFVMKSKAGVGAQNLIVQPAIQTAVVRTNLPDAPATCGQTSKTGDGEAVSALTDISGSTASKYFVRFGMAYKAAAAGEASADVSLQVCAETFGKIVATKTVSLISPDDSIYYQPVTDWMPTAMFSKLKAVFVLQNASGDFRCALGWQFASTSVEQPGSWSNTGTWYDSTNPERCTGEVSAIPGANEMWGRAGIAFKSNTDSITQATVTASVAIRK